MTGQRVDSFWYDVYAGEGQSYHFTVRLQEDGFLHISIDQQPDYPAGRATDGHATHRYGLASGTPWICYAPQPSNLKDARTVAESWARHTTRYNLTGKW